MLLWLGFSALTAIVVVALVRPLFGFGSRAAPLDAIAADMAVYRDQIAEIAADRERGLIGEAEAAAARAEVARRLLAREATAGIAGVAVGAAGSAAGGKGLPISALVLSGLVPVLAIALYLKVGSPGLPARPFEARLNTPAEKATIDELVAKVEARLRANPGDGQGWDVLAPVYMVHGRHQDAAQAYARAISILGESPKRLAGLAEANVLASNGVVNETARLAYERLRALDPSRPEPRFWLAIADEQDGKLDAAAAAYKALLDTGPADAPWRAMVEERLAELNRQRGGASTSSEPSAVARPPDSSGSGGPQVEDIEAASRMTPAERSAMIEGMVGRLAERLKADGKDLAGWMRLVRAYAVLGRRDEAREALRTARSHFPGEAAALAELDQLAKALELGTP